MPTSNLNTTSSALDKQKEELVRLFKDDRLLAHKFLFPHRHPEESGDVQLQIVSKLNSKHNRISIKAFRGSSKTTNAEEEVILKALYREEDYILVIGSTYENACAYIATIRQELEMNERILELFGDQVGRPWGESTLVLANGVKIQAMGCGQSMRGKKHNQHRPSLAIVDDLEDEEKVTTDEARKKIEDWFYAVLIPALHPTKSRIIVIGTPLSPQSLVEQIHNDDSWDTLSIPILVTDLETGEERSAWPSRFPLDVVHKLRDEFQRKGKHLLFEREYMCHAEDVQGKPFQANMIQVTPAPFLARPFVICDPARTTNTKTSARTGYIVASWTGESMSVLEGFGAFHKPDETIKTLFDLNKQYNPIYVAVETNALEEYIMQPLRAKMLETGITLPLYPLRAPKDKDGFIKSLQPFYSAGLITHAKSLPDLVAELLSFPSGRKDVVNALAYMLKLRAGRPVYEDFTYNSVSPILEMNPYHPRYFVISSRPAMVAAAIVQYIDGIIRVVWDQVRNAPPQEVFSTMFREAVMIGGDMKVAAPAEQFELYKNSGLPAAFSREHIRPQTLPTAATSEGSLKPWLQKMVRGTPSFMVAREALWTVNALAGGYARRLDKHGTLLDRPDDNEYRLLMEAIEPWAAWLDKSHDMNDNDLQRHYATTTDGRRYLSSLPRRK